MNLFLGVRLIFYYYYHIRVFWTLQRLNWVKLTKLTVISQKFLKSCFGVTDTNFDQSKKQSIHILQSEEKKIKLKQQWLMQ